jgi:hypothetical protein
MVFIGVGLPLPLSLATLAFSLHKFQGVDALMGDHGGVLEKERLWMFHLACSN